MDELNSTAKAVVIRWAVNYSAAVRRVQAEVVTTLEAFAALPKDPTAEGLLSLRDDAPFTLRLEAAVNGALAVSRAACDALAPLNALLLVLGEDAEAVALYRDQDAAAAPDVKVEGVM